MNISDLSALQLRRAAAIKERIAKLQRKLARILGTAAPVDAAPDGRRKKRRFSAATRKKQSNAQKARWAKIRAAKRK